MDRTVTRLAWLGLAFVLIVQIAHAAAETEKEPAESGPDGTPRTIPREKLRFAGRGFDQWKEVMATDLDPQTLVKGMRAFAAFGIRGHAEEAAASIAEALKVATDKEKVATDRDVVQAGFSALAGIGPAGIPPLVEGLKHESADVRLAAASALCIRWKGAHAEAALAAISALITATRDESPAVRRSACLALAYIARADKSGKSPETVVPVLVERVADDDREVRQRAVYALTRMGAKARPAVAGLTRILQAEDRDRDARRGAFSVLRFMGPAARDAVPALIRIVGAEQRDHHDRLEAIQVLRSIGPEAKDAVPVLTELAKKPQSGLRADARSALQKITGKEVEAAPWWKE